MALHRWLYQGGRPKGLTRLINMGWAALHSLGIAPNYMVTLELMGRKSGKTIRFPLAMTLLNGERYLVSMLGMDANWVRNLKAAGGKAVLRHGITEHILLKEVAVEQRAPILKAYLKRAPGARPHMPVSLDAPIPEYEKIAAQYPVYQIEVIH
jgi:deazaflavin-dependent oxidoreductase (nitroreductase family)